MPSNDTYSKEDGKETSSKETGTEKGHNEVKQETYQQRLFNIRMKINQGRKANSKEVENEFKRLSCNKTKGYNIDDDNDNNNDNDDKEKSSTTGDKKKWMKKGSYDIMNVTAQYAEILKDKKVIKQRNTETYGLSSYNNRVVQKVYETDLKALPTLSNGSNNTDNNTSASTVLDKQLTYGSLDSSRVSKSGVDRLEKLLKLKEEKKNKSRKRELDAGDVDFINEKNAVFNKKIKKAFDKYTGNYLIYYSFVTRILTSLLLFYKLK